MAATRTKFQREHDLEYVSNLYLQGWTQQRIAEKLATERPYKVSRQTITNDLKEVNRRWLDNTVIPLDQHRMKELAKIDLLEQHYWTQYFISLEPRKINSKSAKQKPGKPDKEGKPTALVEQTGTERIEQREGNPAYLQGVERCIQMRVKLLGLNAPEKVENSGTIIFEVVREDDHQHPNPQTHPAETTPGTEDYLQ